MSLQILHLNINSFHKKVNDFMKLIHPNIYVKANGHFYFTMLRIEYNEDILECYGVKLIGVE